MSKFRRNDRVIVNAAIAPIRVYHLLEPARADILQDRTFWRATHGGKEVLLPECLMSKVEFPCDD